MKNPEIQQQASLYVKRLPLRAVQRMLETHSEQKPERPPVVTMHRLKAIRDELKILVEGCDAIERVLDQSEAVLRFDDLKDMPGFRQELSAESPLKAVSHGGRSAGLP